jgi:hypothetical protein
MSLDFNLTKIKNYKSVCWRGENMNPVTEALIWSTMAVGIGVISDKTLDKFSQRLRVWERVHGPFLHGRGPITRAEVEDHLGLSTNVFPQESDSRFMKKLLSWAKGSLRADPEPTAPEELVDAAG